MRKYHSHFYLIKQMLSVNLLRGGTNISIDKNFQYFLRNYTFFNKEIRWLWIHVVKLWFVEIVCYVKASEIITRIFIVNKNCSIEVLDFVDYHINTGGVNSTLLAKRSLCENTRSSLGICFLRNCTSYSLNQSAMLFNTNFSFSSNKSDFNLILTYLSI